MAGFVIGITGGTGTGKTALAGYLRRLGAAYYSVDAVAHALYQRDAALAERLARAFGSRILGVDGVDRAALGTAAFASASKLARLNSLVHPALRREARLAIARMRARHRVTVVEAGAILFRLGLAPAMRRIVVTRCARSTRIRRLAKRGGLSAAEISCRLAVLRATERRMLAAARRCRTAVVLDTGESPRALASFAARLMGVRGDAHPA